MPGFTPGELKDITNSGTTSLVSAGVATGNFTLINGVGIGAAASDRVGRRITMKSIYLRYNAQLAATTAGHSPLRLMIVYDKQTNGTGPSAGSDVLTPDKITGMNNLSNSRRFVTLMDRITEPLDVQVRSEVTLEFYKKCNLEVQFNATGAATVADILTGGLFLLIWQNGLLVTASPSGTWSTRVRFSD